MNSRLEPEGRQLRRRRGLLSSWASKRPGAPAITFLFLCVALLLLWQASLWYRDQLIAEERARQAHQLTLYGNALSILIDRSFARLNALHAFAMTSTSAAELEANFTILATGLYSDGKGISNFALAPAGVIRYLYPLKGNERALGHDLLNDPATRLDAARAVSERKIIVSTPYQLRQGGFGLVGRKAVYRNGSFWGLAAMTLDLPSLFNMVGLKAPAGMQIALRDDSGQLFLGDREVFAGDPVVQRIALPEGYWELAALPAGGWDAAIGRSLLLFGSGGVAIGALLTALCYLILSRQQALTLAVGERTLQLARINDELRQEATARLEVEEALRRSEEHLRNLFELIPVGLALCSWDGRLREINPAFAGIIGKTVPETLNLTYWEITPEQYLEQEKQQLASMERTGHYGPYEKEFIHNDGHRVPVRLQGLQVIHEGERYIWSSVEDITERKRLEERLKERNEQFLLFIEHSPAAIAMLDREMRYLIASRRWLTDYRIADREVRGRSHYELFPDISERWKEIHRRCLAGAVESSEEDRFEHADGTVEWIRWEVRPWHLRSGEVGGIIIFSEDITPSVQAEEALRRERDFSDILIDSLPGVVYLYDRNLKLLRWNKNLEQVLGYSADEVATMSPLDFYAPESRELVRNRIEEVFAKGVSYAEAEFIARDGSAKPYYSTGLRTEINGEPCLLGVGIDISARKRLENELLQLNRSLEARVAERTSELQESRLALINMVEDLQETTEALHRANDKLQEVDRLKSMFIASMSHELRTPLNSVIGFTSILLNEWVGPLNAEQKENLGIVLRAGKHLLSLINDVIDVSKIEAGQIEVHQVEFDIFDLIAEATGIMQKEVRDKGLELQVENLHQIMHTDRARLLQCLLNLLANAAKYTEKGEIRLVVRRAQFTGRAHSRGENQGRTDSRRQEQRGATDPTGQEPGRGADSTGKEQKSGADTASPPSCAAALEIAVQDTGIGISPKDRQRLFQPFVRLDSHLRSVVTGTGLGLYLTRKMVQDLLQGSIACESTPGVGSRFALTVPTDNPRTSQQEQQEQSDA